MNVDGVRFMVGWQCAKTIYDEDFDKYTADFEAAVGRRDALRRVREIRDAIAQFSAVAAPPDAALRAYALLEQVVRQQAVLLSYIDVFALFAITAAMLAPVPLALLRPQPTTAPRPGR